MKEINNRNFDKNNIMKPFFHVANVILIIFYLFPGSVLGCFLYSDCNIQPRLTPDFIVSSNHVYIFILISFLGLAAYSKEKVSIKITIYLFFLSIFLEITHLVHPGRGFEVKDMAGNIVGVTISFIAFLIVKLKKINKF